MSATVWGGEVKYTRRFQLGRLLSNITRNFLLLTATPHNGKEDDFHLFLSLVDPDRFEGMQHSTSQQAVDGANVELKLEVEVEAENGIPAATVRTVSENCRTLHVSDFGFED